MSDEVISRLYLFADDTKFYRAINNFTDIQLLQFDMNKLDTWSKMAFTVSSSKMYVCLLADHSY